MSRNMRAAMHSLFYLTCVLSDATAQAAVHPPPGGSGASTSASSPAVSSTSSAPASGSHAAAATAAGTGAPAATAAAAAAVVATAPIDAVIAFSSDSPLCSRVPAAAGGAPSPPPAMPLPELPCRLCSARRCTAMSIPLLLPLPPLPGARSARSAAAAAAAAAAATVPRCSSTVPERKPAGVDGTVSAADAEADGNMPPSTHESTGPPISFWTVARRYCSDLCTGGDSATVSGIWMQNHSSPTRVSCEGMEGHGENVWTGGPAPKHARAHTYTSKHPYPVRHAPECGPSPSAAVPKINANMCSRPARGDL
eukprot:354453-Chlamydomonas_euryale.AAC.2